jgi:hypothetical protein
VVIAAACLVNLLLLVPSVWAQAGGQIGPLRLSANKRYLVDQNNSPFLMQGDSPWSLIVGPNEAEAEQYLKNRHDKGFNTVVVNLIEHNYCKNPPRNAAGDVPFLTPGDFSTPNEKYFAHADWVIRKANEYGIQVLLDATYLGYIESDDGWIREIQKLEPAKCLEWGRYVGKRYKDFDNIIWLMGGDRNPEDWAREKVNLVALGIKEFDKRHLFTAHCHSENPAVTQYSNGGWLDINSVYIYQLVHQQLIESYNRTPVMPFFLLESAYEGEHNSSGAQIRRQAYWSVLLGGFGHTFGNSPIWGFNTGWQAAMDLPGSVSMMHWGNLLRSRAWYELVPDQKHEVVTDGLGEFFGLDLLTAGRTPDGSTVIAYMPTSRTISVDLSKVSGTQAKTSWFDPRNGKITDAGVFPTSGAHSFTPPGDGDWVLVLDDASKHLPPPGAKM